jgi:hypothetical protein
VAQKPYSAALACCMRRVCVVRDLQHVARCMLFAACGLLHVVRCPFHVACCPLHVARCMLHGASDLGVCSAIGLRHTQRDVLIDALCHERLCRSKQTNQRLKALAAERSATQRWMPQRKRRGEARLAAARPPQ